VRGIHSHPHLSPLPSRERKTRKTSPVEGEEGANKAFSLKK
jgi:hypothetical protein